ncbi:unnamed protein product (macronuclear) [Paramecium tetraurelia]|uniref:Nbr1 FW domain-containing protein n=1 Tax=Paramecium tetraurelia TaxID=5888 RepID=A0BS92_PARTE|nr:uncharacterized protein GSPATT00031640001 [Paramecium tetraurelia]CAK61409.1 unnamed protein product [Paramecium tetraurelia]|eukprot:XP_001428807.1 hypothetical protein (macronuclear) [Paramecium tetraurelia strain d4-2]
MSYKYYEAFVSSKSKSIPCCNSLNCNLCLGKYYVQIQQDDINLIDRLIQDKLQSRMAEIQSNIRINTIDQFLDYHQRKYNYQLIYLFENLTKGKPGSQINFNFRYKNNGTIDWPKDTYFKCMEPGEFKELISQVTPLPSGAEATSEISFKIPLIAQGEYKTWWRLCCKRNQEEVLFGPTIEIPCIVEESIDAANYLLLKELQNKGPSWTDPLDFNKAPMVLKEAKDQKLDMDQLYILLLKEQN